MAKDNGTSRVTSNSIGEASSQPGTDPTIQKARPIHQKMHLDLNAARRVLPQ